MAVTRTAKGTAKAKASGTSLTVSGVAVTADRALIVGIGYAGDVAPSSVKWGGRHLRRKAHHYASNPDLSVVVYIARRINKTGTRDIVATWPTSIGKRVMFVTELDTELRIDQTSTKKEGTATAAPATGQTALLATAADFAIGAFVSEGPSSDAAGTAQIEDDDSWQSATSGQRDGTAGAPPLSNITIQETFLELTSTATTRARLQNAGSRKWVNAIITLRPITYTRDVFSPTGHDFAEPATFSAALTDVEAEVDTMVADGHVIRRVQYILENPQTGDICYVEAVED